jgi:hypothetical protein
MWLLAFVSGTKPILPSRSLDGCGALASFFYPRPRALVQHGASLVSSGEAPAGTHRGQTGIGVSVLSSEGASDGLGVPPNDLLTSSGEGASVRVGGGVPRFSRPVPLVVYRLGTWLAHPNGTVAPQGSYRLGFL